MPHLGVPKKGSYLDSHLREDFACKPVCVGDPPRMECACDVHSGRSLARKPGNSVQAVTRKADAQWDLTVVLESTPASDSVSLSY